MAEERAYCCGDVLMKVLILGNVAVENIFETREDSLRRLKEAGRALAIYSHTTRIRSRRTSKRPPSGTNESEVHECFFHWW